MTVENIPTPILEWLAWNIPLGLAVFIILAIGGILFGFLVAAFRHGPGDAFYLTAKVIFTGMAELTQISAQRVLAMARLSFKESIRRRGLVAFGVFVVILLFAGWFLDVKSTDPGKLYISFVLTSTNYLILGLALFLSAFSLPTDIKNRTIYTIMTKPVRAWEIVLGRICGFCAIGTVLLVTMGIVCYLFVQRGLSHSHTVDVESVIAIEETPGKLQGKTARSRQNQHVHEFTAQGDDADSTDLRRGHRHSVMREGNGENAQYKIGPPQGALLARVPIYARNLRFLDRTGKPGQSISVGYEWTYRGYFEGGTLAAAIWTFEGISREQFSNGLPLEWTVSVFRTHKGNIEKGVTGSWTLRNPDPAKNKESPRFSFESKEFSSDSMLFPEKLELADGKSVDIFDEYVDDSGRVELILRCEDSAQYFGVAQADLYLRQSNGDFLWNFTKGYLSIWMQMLLVIAMGVMFSTFLSAPVAMLATIGSVVMGFFTSSITALARSVFYPENAEIPGGGPFESTIRILKQTNVTLDLDLGIATTVIKAIDLVIMFFMWAVAVALPDFSHFETVPYVAEGFNIPIDLCGQQVVIGLAYALVATCLGYFFLRTREIAG